jgi:ADP-heptose:LPS heptosyltransferase
MYRDRQYPVWLNVLFDNGGLGDLIAWLPPLKFIHQNHPHVRLYVWMPDFFVDFAKNCLKGTEDRIFVSKWSDGSKHFKAGNPSRSFAQQPYSNLGAHMTEHAFEIICHTKPEDKNAFNYLKPDLKNVSISHFSLPNKYVVITTGFTAAVREMVPFVVNDISQYVVSHGFTPVFLGKKQTPSGKAHVIQGNFNEAIDYSSGVDLIDKTNLFECAAICGNASAVVGLDNGILHVAGCTDTPIVGGFTTVNPTHRMPYRNGVLGWQYYPVVPPSSLKCRFCQSNWHYTLNHDFKECFYGDLACTKELKAELYIEQLEKILK